MEEDDAIICKWRVAFSTLSDDYKSCVNTFVEQTKCFICLQIYCISANNSPMICIYKKGLASEIIHIDTLRHEPDIDNTHKFYINDNLYFLCEYAGGILFADVDGEVSYIVKNKTVDNVLRNIMDTVHGEVNLAKNIMFDDY